LDVRDSANTRGFVLVQAVTWELYAASVILIVAVVVVFMLLRFVAILKTLEDTHGALVVYMAITEKLWKRVFPRDLFEMDLPPEVSADKGGESIN
jgi:hypothetical protein